MLNPNHKLAIYLEASLNSDYAKMGHGVMRYSNNEVLCVIDSEHAGKTIKEATGKDFNIPIVSSITEAHKLGADVLILGIAPSGGRIPEAWMEPLKTAMVYGMNIVNGLHDKLATRLEPLKSNTDQWVWDVRVPAFVPKVGKARAAELNNKRVLMVGTDMAVGKMTAGLEINKWLRENGRDSEFLPTGQIGITVSGKGIPLDAFIVDQACGAVEQMVLENAEHDILIIEGQGSLLHPGSTATLPLMRGSCATHLILCHRAEMKTLRDPTNILIPSLKEFIALNEQLTSVCGSLTAAKCVGIALNSSNSTEEEALQMITELEAELEIPVTDVLRFGAEKLGLAILNH